MKLRLPRASELFDRASDAARRFPLVLLAALAAAVAAVRLVGLSAPGLYPYPGRGPWTRSLQALLLAIPLLLGLDLAAERRGWSRRARGLGALVAAGGLLLYALWLPWPMYGAEGWRQSLLLAAAVAWVAVAPWIGAGSERDFWSFDVALLRRVLLAALFSAVLYAGLGLAVAACQVLLGLDLGFGFYGKLGIAVGLVYGSWFFLAGVPRLPEGTGGAAPPAGLRGFAAYVLLPLVAIYGLILYAYLIRILLAGHLPETPVVGPVVGFAVAGILAFLLVWPFAEEGGGGGWIARFCRAYFPALLPLIGLAGTATVAEISRRGVTIDDYVVLAGLLWLTGVSLWLLLRGRRRIRGIPLTLAAVALLCALGPWSAPAVAHRSQLGRLEGQLVSLGRMAEGRLRSVEAGPAGAAAPAVSDSARQALSAALDRLREGWGLREVRGWLAAAPEDTARLTPQAVLSAAGLEYVPAWERRKAAGIPGRLEVSRPEPEALPVAGYAWLHRFSLGFANGAMPSRRVALDAETVLAIDGARFRVLAGPDSAAALTLDLRTSLGTEPGELTVEREEGGYRMRVYLTGVVGRQEEGRLEPALLRGLVLVGRTDDG